MWYVKGTVYILGQIQIYFNKFCTLEMNGKNKIYYYQTSSLADIDELSYSVVFHFNSQFAHIFKVIWAILINACNFYSRLNDTKVIKIDKISQNKTQIQTATFSWLTVHSLSMTKTAGQTKYFQNTYWCVTASRSTNRRAITY